MKLEATLARGLDRLPLDREQRARARTLAQDAVASDIGGALDDDRGVAAAIAYAIVYVDHIPLTQTEVASCFRVSVAAVRGRFSELRSRLDLTRGDSRYATRRDSS